MNTQDYLIVAAVFLLAVGTGFAIHQSYQTDGDSQFVSDVTVRVDSDTQVSNTEFDGHFIELRYEDTEKAKFYYKFNDTRNVEQIEGLTHDGKLQTHRDIKSFGNQTYFLYLRYIDDPNQTDDGYLELYRIEET